MKIKIFVAVGFLYGLSFNLLCADALKNSLTQMIKQQDNMPSMVDLTQLSQPKKVASKVKKTRSPNSVVAMVNGISILKKEADRHLKERTKGKIRNFDYLPRKQRMMLIKEMALPKIIAKKAKSELTQREKESVYSRIWMQQQIAKTVVNEDEIHGIYLQMKQNAIDHNSTQKIPEYEAMKERIKMQVIDRKVIGKLMKDIDIQIVNL